LYPTDFLRGLGARGGNNKKRNRKPIMNFGYYIVKTELALLKQKMRAYLEHPSSDGHMIRKQMREELKVLVALKSFNET